MPHTPLLDKINNPQDLKKLDVSELKALADELRLELIDAVSVTLGVPVGVAVFVIVGVGVKPKVAVGVGVTDTHEFQ